jgi:hypothetical protein
MNAPRSTLLLAAGVALFAPVAGAHADVPVRVPARFLGGPIAEPLPTVSPLAVGVRSEDATSAGCGGPARDCLVLLADPDTIEEIPLPEPGPSSGITGPDDDPDTPDGQAQANLARPDDATEFGGLMLPAAGGWDRGPAPKLRWNTWPGAASYVVQVQRGPQLIASARTRGSGLTLPARAVWMGRTFGWAVWALDASGAPMNTGAPIGRSVFGIYPRLRAVFRPTTAGVRGEVRPHVPRGTLLVRLPGRSPLRVRLDAKSRFSLPLSAVDAERSRITLVARGPRAPLGLWR